MLEEYAGSVPASVELLTSAAGRLDGEQRTEALAELALARFRLNDVAGVAGCATAIGAVADPTIHGSGCWRTSPGGSPPPSPATRPPGVCC